MRKKLLLAIAFSLGIWAYLLLLTGTPRFGAAAGLTTPMAPEDGMTALFSPNGGCTDAIVAEIAKANQSIDVQAYAFTSPVLAEALAEASSRDVRVRIVLDKGQRKDHYSAAPTLASHHVHVYIDDQHALAHNNVMIIDGHVLITGSFTFTKASEEKNAENLLIIRDRPHLIAAYADNFKHHFSHSIPLMTEEEK